MTGPTAIAKFKGGKDELIVHFNPSSLRISLTNQFGEDPPQQHAKPTSTKLDVELIFDTTETGDDVRAVIDPLRKMATATAKETAQKPAAGKKEEANHSLPLVIFSWGTAKYHGIIESMTQALDYWSSDGVPLRATVQIGMKGAAESFFGGRLKKAGYFDKAGEAITLQDDVVPIEAPPATTGATGAAAKAGDPGAGRMLAALNGLENMRAPAGAALGASASVNLSAAAGFELSGGISAGALVGFGIGASAGASASAGLSGSVGVGMSAGAGIGMGGGIGIGASAGAGIGMSGGIGMSAGAGIGIGGSAGIGMSGGAGIGIGGSAGIGLSGGAGGIGITTSSSSSVTGLDGVTHSRSSTSFTGIGADGSIVSTGSATAGVSMSQGAFAGLGSSKTTLPSASFNPNALLGPPMPSVGPDARFDSTGKLLSGGGQVAASYSAGASVTFF